MINLLQAHAWMMVISWGVLLPSGVVVARSFKTLGPVWFQIHRAVQIVGLTTALAGGVGPCVCARVCAHVNGWVGAQEASVMRQCAGAGGCAVPILCPSLQCCRVLYIGGVHVRVNCLPRERGSEPAMKLCT